MSPEKGKFFFLENMFHIVFLGDLRCFVGNLTKVTCVLVVETKGYFQMDVSFLKPFTDAPYDKSDRFGFHDCRKVPGHQRVLNGDFLHPEYPPNLLRNRDLSVS